MVESGHNFAHAMADQLPWHVQNYDLVWSLFIKLEQNAFLLVGVCKLFVKQAPDVTS